MDDIPLKEEMLEDNETTYNNTFFVCDETEDDDVSKKKNKRTGSEKIMVSQFMNPSFLREFIELYRNTPCLWQMSCKEYTHRPSRDAAIEVLLDFTRETIPGATVFFIKKRMDNIRCCFRRELIKVRKSRASGEKHLYVPRLWYYQLLEFLTTNESPNESKSQLPSYVDGYKEEMVPQIECHYEELSEEPSSEVSSPTAAKKRKCIKESVPVMKKLTQTATKETNEIPSTATSENMLNTVITALQDKDDEYDAVGKSVAAKLRKMSDIQKIYCEKLINDVLYKGLLEQLDATSNVT